MFAYDKGNNRLKPASNSINNYYNNQGHDRIDSSNSWWVPLY